MNLGDINKGLVLWIVLAMPSCGILYFFTREPFHLFMLCMTIGSFVYTFTGWFDDLTEDSSDWETGEDDPKQISGLSLIGLVALFLSSLILSFLVMDGTYDFVPSIWVPHEIFNPLDFTGPEILSFTFAIAGTAFSVVPGEEGLKDLLSATHKIEEHVEFFDGWPFAAHPSRIGANAIWASLHVSLWQQPPPFFFSVFVAGIIMDCCSARSGTILTNRYIHFLFNTIILTASFILGGFLTIVW